MARLSSQNNALGSAFSESLNSPFSAFLIELRQFDTSENAAGRFDLVDAGLERPYPLCPFGRRLRDKGDASTVLHQHTAIALELRILPQHIIEVSYCSL